MLMKLEATIWDHSETTIRFRPLELSAAISETDIPNEMLGHLKSYLWWKK